MTVKDMILEANEHIKSTARILKDVYENIGREFDPALIENSNVALGELIKGIKYLALLHGDITGNELLPREQQQVQTKEADAPLNS